MVCEWEVCVSEDIGVSSTPGSVRWIVENNGVDQCGTKFWIQYHCKSFSGDSKKKSLKCFSKVAT